MIRLLGPATKLCDGIDRREMLRIGALSMTGLTLPQFLTPASASKQTASRPSGFGKAKNCIILFLSGGPSQHDTYDPKPDAPSEIRGEFSTIPSSLPGLRVTEHLPRSAKIMDKVALIRSMTHKNPDHASGGY